MSLLATIFSTPDVEGYAPSDYDIEPRLVAEIAIREEHGLTSDLAELRDTLDAIHENWAEQSRCESEAERLNEQALYGAGYYDEYGYSADDQRAADSYRNF